MTAGAPILSIINIVCTVPLACACAALDDFEHFVEDVVRTPLAEWHQTAEL